MGNTSKRNTKRARAKRAKNSAARPSKPLRTVSYQDGTPMCVARPSYPERALELTKQAIEADTAWADLQEKLNAECGPYTFVGFLGMPGEKVVDADGKILGEMQPGDSFMHISVLEEQKTK
jgi:hypothetical protein